MSEITPPLCIECRHVRSRRGLFGPFCVKYPLKSVVDGDSPAPCSFNRKYEERCGYAGKGFERDTHSVELITFALLGGMFLFWWFT